MSGDRYKQQAVVIWGYQVTGLFRLRLPVCAGISARIDVMIYDSAVTSHYNETDSTQDDMLKRVFHRNNVKNSMLIN